MAEIIDLGFAEECEDEFRLSAISYPSKLGGKPAWLRWDKLLTEAQMHCLVCEKILQFLCQIYIPTELSGQQYHRTLYVFCCSNGKCYKSTSTKNSSGAGCIKVFRSLMEESDDDLTEEDLDNKVEEELRKAMQDKESLWTTCEVCSLYGEKRCSLCRNVLYCSKEHQVFDWKVNDHKKECQSIRNNSTKNKFLFEEYEIVIEEEPTKDKKSEEDRKLNIDESRLKDLMKDTGPLDSNLENEFKKATNTVDENFDKFKRRIGREPKQIIRYNLGGTPLWVSSERIPKEDDIPACKCGSQRQYEFQILPQLLNYLGIETTVDSIDWGTLCIYTCKDNCNLEPYQDEFVWKQDFSETNI